MLFQHTIRPGSYFWTFHSQPPPRSHQVRDLDDGFYFDRNTPDSPNGHDIYLSDSEVVFLLSQLGIEDDLSSLSSSDDDDDD